MKKDNRSLYLTALFAVLILIGIGYAALTTTLNITGTTTIKKTTWDVHFENISTNDSEAIKFYAPTDSAMSNPITNISGMNATTLKYTVNLTGPDRNSGITHDMNVDVVNKGTIDARIASLTLPDFGAPDTDSAPHSALLHMTTEKCSYSDGTEVKVGDVIAAGSSKTITCKHHYKSTSELTTEDLKAWDPIYGSTATRDFSLTINFMSAG